MTPEQMQNFRTILERAEFLSVRDLVEDREDMWGASPANLRVHGSTIEDVSTDPGNLGHGAGPLAEIRDALVRIEKDKFGICVSCGQAIELGRLTAMPWTAFCLECEENAEAVDALSPGLNSAGTNEGPGAGPPKAQSAQSGT